MWAVILTVFLVLLVFLPSTGAVQPNKAEDSIIKISNQSNKFKDVRVFCFEGVARRPPLNVLVYFQYPTDEAIIEVPSKWKRPVCVGKYDELYVVLDKPENILRNCKSGECKYRITNNGFVKWDNASKNWKPIVVQTSSISPETAQLHL